MNSRLDAGIVCGRLDRSVIGSPAAYRLAQRLTVV